MCTVSIVSNKGRVIITSNRDEKTLRGQALPPGVHMLGDKSALYPKDTSAGGTWFVADSSGYAGVLLNGAFRKHLRAESYRRSRGLVLLDIMKEADPYNAFVNIDLERIEPFTLILCSSLLAYELRWDGIQKHDRELSLENSHIWSSVTLYTDDIIKKREQWFAAFMAEYPEPDPEHLREFHSNGGEGDLQNDLVMQRQGITQTFSITQAVIDNGQVLMSHSDLLEPNIYSETLTFAAHG